MLIYESTRGAVLRSVSPAEMRAHEGCEVMHRWRILNNQELRAIVEDCETHCPLPGIQPPSTFPLRARQRSRKDADTRKQDSEPELHT